MADVGNGSLGARKRREMNGVGGSSPVKKMKFEDDEPPEANPNTLEAVRHRNKELSLDLMEKNRRIAFLAHKCESLFRQSAVAHHAFRCIQRQWVQLIDDISSASRVLSIEGTEEWRETVSKTESLGILRLPSDAVNVALPEWFLAISRGDEEAEVPAEDEEDTEPLETKSELLNEKEKQVEKSLQDQQRQVNSALEKLLAALSNGSSKTLELKQLVADKREASSQVLELKGELEAMRRKMADVQADLEAKEVERHRACRSFDRLKEQIERSRKAHEVPNGVKFENGNTASDDNEDKKLPTRTGEKRVTLVDPDVKPSVDREVVQKLNADKSILLQKLKEERQKVESMRSELTRLQAVETAADLENTRLRQEFDATVARLQGEKSHIEEEFAAFRATEKEALRQVQDTWKTQLEKVQDDAAKTKAKFDELVFKNTALRDKLSSFSAYRDQLSDAKAQHEALKRETDRLKENLEREKARGDRVVTAAETKQIIGLREKLAGVERERDLLRQRVEKLTESLEKSADTKLSDAIRRETNAQDSLKTQGEEMAKLRADIANVQVELETAVMSQTAFKDENDALVSEIEVLNKEIESARHSKKKVLKQLEEKRQSAKKMQAELAKESDARSHSTEELATVRLQVSTLKYVHSQQKAALEAAKEVQKAREQELVDLKKAFETLQRERDGFAADKTKLDRELEVAKQMYKAEAAHKQRQVLQDKSRPCDRCETYRKKEADFEKQIAKLKANTSSSGGDGGGLTDLERFELQDLQKQLKCSVCQDRHKNVIISKCSHLFCKECIDSNLRSRNRKCPTCKKMFGQDDVKSVWFT